jgi:ADP-heptose:LPS heptosyltransferase
MVAIFKVNGFGDNVVFVPAVQALRSRLPGLAITLITTPEVGELYGGPLGPQRVITVPKPAFNKAYRRPWALASWILRVRALRPEACLVSYDQGSVAQLASRWSGARVRIGANPGNTRVHSSSTGEVPLPSDGCLATWNWDMARALARALGDTGEWEARPPAPDLRHLASAPARPRGERKRIVVHPGAGKALNQWPPQLFASVAASLAGEFDVVWVSHGGTTGDAPRGATQASVRSIAELAGWLSGADLFLGNNSGPMHLANALGCPGVAVTGSSALGWNPYWHRDRWSVLRHPNLYCAPCEAPNREPSGCANLESPMACMKYWTPPMVEGACRERLSRGDPGPP